MYENTRIDEQEENRDKKVNVKKDVLKKRINIFIYFFLYVNTVYDNNIYISIENVIAGGPEAKLDD